MGNVAFNVNRLFVFRFPKTPIHQQELASEIPLLSVVARYSALPIPRPEFVAPRQAYMGYRKLRGTPLIYLTERFTAWPIFAAQMGQFLGAINAIPVEALRGLEVNTDFESLDDVRRDAARDYQKLRGVIPSTRVASIEAFFDSPAPASEFEPKLCHNDLGIEHVLVTDTDVTGIIDWGDIALTDPAHDFGLLFRDLGPDVLDQTLAAYGAATGCMTGPLRQRAMFYGRCRIFENIAYGVEQNRPEYSQTGLEALRWLFPAR